MYRGTLTSTMIITLTLVAGLTAVAFIKPEWISLGWGQALTMALLIGILAWVVPMFVADPEAPSTQGYYRVLSAFFVFLFMILIL